MEDAIASIRAATMTTAIVITVMNAGVLEEA